MRFTVGPPPQSDDFDPESGGWRRLRELGPGALVLLGSLVGLPLCYLFIVAWTTLAPVSVSLRLDLGVQGALGPILAMGIAAVSLVLLVAGIVIVHEFIHAFTYPSFGMTASSVIGFWPSRVMPYAAYLDEMSCVRFVVVALAPLAVLSLAPLLICYATGSESTLLAAVSCLNALISGGDVLIVLTAAVQVPPFAKIRNKGWHTWWMTD